MWQQEKGLSCCCKTWKLLTESQPLANQIGQEIYQKHPRNKIQQTKRGIPGVLPSYSHTFSPYTNNRLNIVIRAWEGPVLASWPHSSCRCGPPVSSSRQKIENKDSSGVLVLRYTKSESCKEQQSDHCWCQRVEWCWVWVTPASHWGLVWKGLQTAPWNILSLGSLCSFLLI